MGFGLVFELGWGASEPTDLHLDDCGIQVRCRVEVKLCQEAERCANVSRLLFSLGWDAMGCETSSRSVRKPRVENKSYIIVVHMLKVESIKRLLLQSMLL